MRTIRQGCQYSSKPYQELHDTPAAVDRLRLVRFLSTVQIWLTELSLVPERAGGRDVMALCASPQVEPLSRSRINTYGLYRLGSIYKQHRRDWCCSFQSRSGATSRMILQCNGAKSWMIVIEDMTICTEEQRRL